MLVNEYTLVLNICYQLTLVFIVRLRSDTLSDTLFR